MKMPEHTTKNKTPFPQPSNLAQMNHNYDTVAPSEDLHFFISLNKQEIQQNYYDQT